MELFEHIRRDRREDGVSIRGLAHRHRVHPQRSRAALSDGSSLRSAPGTARRTPAHPPTLRQPGIPPRQASIGGFGIGFTARTEVVASRLTFIVRSAAPASAIPSRWDRVVTARWRL